MGIHDDAREWFVFHMMRQAERNNLKMAGILEGFSAEGEHAPETLGCCHKVCKDCWSSWSSVMGGRPFCPLCRHDEFLGAVAARVTDAPAPRVIDSDSED